MKGLITIIIIIHQRQSEYCQIIPQDEVKENIQQYSLNLRRIILFSIIIITQVIIRATVFSFLLSVSFSETSSISAAAILKISASEQL